MQVESRMTEKYRTEKWDQICAAESRARFSVLHFSVVPSATAGWLSKKKLRSVEGRAPSRPFLLAPLPLCFIRACCLVRETRRQLLPRHLGKAHYPAGTTESVPCCRFTRKFLLCNTASYA